MRERKTSCSDQVTSDLGVRSYNASFIFTLLLSVPFHLCRSLKHNLRSQLLSSFLKFQNLVDRILIKLCVMCVTCYHVTCLTRNVSCQHVFGRVYFNVLKFWKPKHAQLKHVTHLADRVKCVRVEYMSTLVARTNSTNFK
jgi:hypothetical protein